VTTWEGNRRAQVFRWRRIFTVRERLEALGEKTRLAERFAEAHAAGRFHYPAAPPGRPPAKHPSKPATRAKGF